MQQNKNLNNNDNIFCSLQVHHGLLPECLSAVSGAPPRNSVSLHALGWGASDTAT
jgi:hypothetical protein